MKLHIGCGNKLFEGYENVDKTKPSNEFPEETLEKLFSKWDIEDTPWILHRIRIANSSIDAILAVHVMEHISKNYFEIWQEIYRICKPDAIVDITVPHFNHDNFHNDPTHKMEITPSGLEMFSKKFNQRCIKEGYSNSTFGLDYNFDFEIVEKEEILDPFWKARKSFQNIQDPEMEMIKRSYNNVISEYRIKLKVIK